MIKPNKEIITIKALMRDIAEKMNVFQDEINELKTQLEEVINLKEQELKKDLTEINNKIKEIERGEIK